MTADMASKLSAATEMAQKIEELKLKEKIIDDKTEKLERTLSQD